MSNTGHTPSKAKPSKTRPVVLGCYSLGWQAKHEHSGKRNRFYPGLNRIVKVDYEEPDLLFDLAVAAAPSRADDGAPVRRCRGTLRQHPAVPILTNLRPVDACVADAAAMLSGGREFHCAR